jgi:hypothetical protein
MRCDVVLSCAMARSIVLGGIGKIISSLISVMKTFPGEHGARVLPSNKLALCLHDNSIMMLGARGGGN